MDKKFKAIVVGAYGDINSVGVKNIKIRDIPEGHVLIRTEFASISPMDELVYAGQWPYKLISDTLGVQGSGTVVKSGGGVLANSLLNKRVAFLCYGPHATGAFAEYVVTSANYVEPILDTLSFEQATVLHNHLTVEYMMKKIKKGNHKVIIQSAAASNIGKCLIRYCNYLGLTTINIVRRADQIEVLNALGAQYVISTSEEGWRDRVKDISRRLNATIAFDAVSGEMTGDLYEMIQAPGIVYVYGTLSREPLMINPMSFTKGKKITGIYVMPWLDKMSVLTRAKIFEKIQRIHDQIFRTTFCATVGYDNFNEALDSYRARKTNSKILLRTRITDT